MTVARPVARVYLDGDYTFRWHRGDRLAFVFLGREDGDSDHTAGAVDSVPVSESGWTDVSEVRRAAKRWLLQRGKVA